MTVQLTPEMVNSVPEPVVPIPTEPVAPVADPAKDPVDPVAPVVDPAAPPVEPTEALFDLPDGRKVNAETLQQEYKNLLSDYTPKAQKLAEYERVNQPPKEDIVPEWKKPDYQPKTWAEAIEIAKNQALEELANAGAAEERRVADIAAVVNTALTEIKKTDPTLDENALFLHATKYGFRDIKAAYTNMRDLKQVATDTEARVLKNVKVRAADPVAVNPGANTPSDAIDYNNLKNMGSPLEFLQRLKK